MKLHIRHLTRYRYADTASYSVQYLRLTPRRDGGQRTLDWRLRAPGRLHWQTDAFGNETCLMTVEGPHREIDVQVDGIVETNDAVAGRVDDDERLSTLVYQVPTALTRSDADIVRMAESWQPQGATDDRGLQSLMSMIAERVRYQPGSSAVTDSAADAVRRGEGVCQDQAHVGLAICRAAGVPARYVSGYVLAGEHAADQSIATHAWFEVWQAEAGRWRGCDVTHGGFAGSRLCRLAVGRDYLDAAPVRGMRRGGGEEQMLVDVSVTATEQQ